MVGDRERCVGGELIHSEGISLNRPAHPHRHKPPREPEAAPAPTSPIPLGKSYPINYFHSCAKITDAVRDHLRSQLIFFEVNMIKSAALFVSILLLANPLCAETPNSIIAGAIVNDWTQAGLRVTDKLGKNVKGLR